MECMILVQSYESRNIFCDLTISMTAPFPCRVRQYQARDEYCPSLYFGSREPNTQRHLTSHLVIHTECAAPLSQMLTAGAPLFSAIMVYKLVCVGTTLSRHLSFTSLPNSNNQWPNVWFQLALMVAVLCEAHPTADRDSPQSTTEDISVLYSLYGAPAKGVLLPTDTPSSGDGVHPHHAFQPSFVAMDFSSPFQSAISDFNLDGFKETLNGG